MKYRITHTTEYIYSDTATLCQNQAHLTPRAFERQNCLNGKLEISPPPAIQRPWIDVFGNAATYFSIEQPHDSLTVTAQIKAEVTHDASAPQNYEFTWEQVAKRLTERTEADWIEPAMFAFDSPRIHRGEKVRQFAAETFTPRRPMYEALVDLTARIYNEFQYDKTATSVTTPPVEVLQNRRGVCQDFAHLQIACLRSLGLSARYVSGYLVTRPPPGQPRLVGADASHAWLSVYFPDWGWLDVDPTNNRLPGFDYITLAWGRDYNDVCPIKGVFFGGGAHSMHVSVDVVAVDV